MTQRLRITFSAAGPLRWVSHLDMLRTWERTIRRSGLPLAYSQGFSPHPRLALAAPLPVGVTGARELIEVWLELDLPVREVSSRLLEAMPPGLAISTVQVVPQQLPSMQSCLESAHYEVKLALDRGDRPRLAASVERLLAIERLDWEEQRGEKIRRYDLRETILDLSVDDDPAETRLAMHLSLAEGRTGRPQQVLLALGVQSEPLDIVRQSITLRESSSVAS